MSVAHIVRHQKHYLPAFRFGVNARHCPSWLDVCGNNCDGVALSLQLNITRSRSSHLTSPVTPTPAGRPKGSHTASFSSHTSENLSVGQRKVA